MTYKDYNDMVDKFLENNSSEIFGNFSPIHAEYIVRRFIESAQHSVEILSGSFPDEFYDKNHAIYDVIRRTALYLASRDGAVRIITVDGNISPALVNLREELKGVGLEYRAAQFKRPEGTPPLSHFMVIDGMRYRLENPHLDQGGVPETVKAEVCCNGPGKARQLLEFFNKAWLLLAPRVHEEAVFNNG